MSSPSTSRVLAATLFLVGICQGCKDSPDPPPGALSDVNNFSYSAELQVQAQVLAEHEDSLFDWSALSRDLLGDVVEATDVGEALLLVMPALAHDEVVDKLVTDKLIMADVAGYFLCEPEGTDCNFSEFGIRGSYPGPQNYFIEGSGSWLVVLASDMGLGQVSMLFLEPRADSDSTLASFDDDSASLDLAVDLRSLQPVSVPLDGDLVARPRRPAGGVILQPRSSNSSRSSRCRGRRRWRWRPRCCPPPRATGGSARCGGPRDARLPE